jgi:pSer/pThr/pTyr-binding forkhead associated (FHA) protein
MAKILLFLENAFVAEYPLEKAKTNIGRRPSNEIHIDNLAVSGEHAVIVKMGKDFYIEDVGSTNGTTVNGEDIQKHLLQHGDVIELSRHQLKFIVEENLSHLGTEQKAEEAGFEKTVMVRPSIQKQESVMAQPEQISALNPIASDTLPEAETLAEPMPTVQPEVVQASPVSAPVASAQPVSKIQVLNGSSVGRELVLNKAMTTLGKPGVQVAVITRRANGFFVTHVEGKVYPVLNNKSIGAQAYALTNHDVIEIAGVKMEFLTDSAVVE